MSDPASSSAAATYPAPFWTPSLAAAESALSPIRRELKHFPSDRLRVSRVGQLDADLLDRELENILKEPVWNALEALGRIGSRPAKEYEPELLAIVRFAIMRLSLFDVGAASYGARLQNLKYRNEWRHRGGLQSTAHDSSPTIFQKSLYTALHILPSYFHARAQGFMLSAGWGDNPSAEHWTDLFLPLAKKDRESSGAGRRRRGEEVGRRRRHWKKLAWETMNRVEKAWMTVGLVNFLVFLYDGRYRTVIDRILGMRLIYAQRAMTRNVSFEFLNRQLVWEAFTEFLLFLMPLINLRKLRIRLLRIVRRSASLTLLLKYLPERLRQALHLPAPPRKRRTRPGQEPKENKEGPLHYLPDHICAICHSISSAPPTTLPEAASDPTDPGVSTSALASLSLAEGRGAGALGENEAKVPYVTDCCGARYCYYCIVGRMVAWEEEEGGDDGSRDTEDGAKKGWECLRCGKAVREVWRWTGEEFEASQKEKETAQEQ